MTTLLPYLNKYRLVTPEVYEDLALQGANATKVERLMAELPRSGENFLARFIKCLQESARDEPGTCHEQIADVLEEELKLRNSPGRITTHLHALYPPPPPPPPPPAPSSQVPVFNNGLLKVEGS